jgi:hypothetical protein
MRILILELAGVAVMLAFLWGACAYLNHEFLVRAAPTAAAPTTPSDCGPYHWRYNRHGQH